MQLLARRLPSRLQGPRLRRVTAAASHQRLLRYPDGGGERVLLYSGPTEQEEEATSDAESDSAVCSWFNDYCQWDGQLTSELWADSPAAPVDPSSRVSDAPPPVFEEDEFFRELEQRHGGAADIKELVSSSYEVLSGCPWVAPRPLYAVVVQLRGTETASLYTLRTRIAAGEAVQDELARALGSRELASRLTISHMRDGVVAFESDDDAERFCSQLEDDVEGEVDYLEMGSHDLFRTVGDVSGVVVYVPHRDFLPMPYQLQAAVKGGALLDE